MEIERKDADESKNETASEIVQQKAELTNEETTEPTDKSEEHLPESSDPAETEPTTTEEVADSAQEDVSNPVSTEEPALEEMKVKEPELSAPPAPTTVSTEKGLPESTDAVKTEIVATSELADVTNIEEPTSTTTEDTTSIAEENKAPDTPAASEQVSVPVEAVKSEETKTDPDQKEATTSDELAPSETSTETPIAVADTETVTAEAAASPEEKKEESKSEEEPKSGDQFDGVAFDKLTKEELLKTAAELSELSDPRRAEGISRDVKNAFDAIFGKERAEALEKFTAEGGETSDFEYKHDPDAEKFEGYLKTIRERKAKYYHELEKQKDSNLERKNELLEKLRHIVDSEESTTSINILKTLQAEWKSIGPVPGAQNKTLWANYNALIDRFYDNRSIYFELKELDRKKNLDAKLELCDKAEKLDEETNIKEAVKVLNELHEEFKHIGPVPKDDQEELWQRFKAASDKIYVKRKGFVDQLKTELKENMTRKLALGDEATALLSFDSDRINEWNDKTKELLELQKKWESIGGLPREHAKEVNKKFWAAFKGFFANKNKFFKQLESMRDENLVKKEALVAQAEALIASTDWNATAEEFKKLQNQWKEIGPVPEKTRNEIYKKFKAAGDAFFNKRREQNKGADKEFEGNLKLKQDICDKLEALAKSDSLDQEEVFKLQNDFGQIGFVPRNAIKKIQKRYDLALESVMKGADMSEEEMSSFKANLSVNKLKGGPNGDRRLDRKEQGVRRRITQLESDLNTWRTNMEFFASSAKADKLKDQVEGRINEAQAELDALKAELRVIRNS
ncbi:MAG: DUF349 domain-containing protein [Cyclobacteriaceae bacterium]